MKVILIKPFLLARTNGGDISLIEHLENFAAWGWAPEVHLVLPEHDWQMFQNQIAGMGFRLDKDGYSIGSLKCQVKTLSGVSPYDPKFQKQYEDKYLEIIEASKPDFVFTHYTDFFSTSSALKWNAHRSWIFQTDNEFPRLSKLKEFPSLYSVYKSIQNFLVASSFMENQVREAFPQSHIFHLPNPIRSLETGRTQVDEMGEYWLFINPVEEKGWSFVQQLAKLRPSENFLVIGNWGREETQVSNLANISFLKRQNNLDSIFAKAYALLYPSVWEEAFGRLPLEAMAAGLPVVASNRGALSETVGGGGLSLDLDESKWLDAMDQVKRNRKDFSQRGQKRVEDYLKFRENQHLVFKKYLEEAANKSST